MDVIDMRGLSFDDVLIVPKRSKLISRKEADLSTNLTLRTPLDIPIVAANMPAVTEWEMCSAIHKMGGFGFLHRFMTITENVQEFLKSDPYNPQAFPWYPPSPAGISLGLHEGFDRLDALYEVGARVFLVDVAHAHSDPVLKFAGDCKSRYHDIDLVVGNVATAKAVKDLELQGVDAIKVGIGPGAACTTREVTGAGRAQFTAIQECASASNVPIIADGGIKNSGDTTKALAAGASTVMLGRLLAGCNESPVPGSYWGNASARMNGHRAPEGTEGNVALTGSLEDTLKPLLWGLRSGISYAGATGVKDLPLVAEFEEVATGVAAESATRI